MKLPSKNHQKFAFCPNVEGGQQIRRVQITEGGQPAPLDLCQNGPFHPLPHSETAPESNNCYKFKGKFLQK